MITCDKGLCSICCVGYKHAIFLEDCIQSIWNNDYKNIEIISIDDGSDDGSLEKLKILQKQSPCPFFIIEQEHTGNIAKNFNRVYSMAKGEYILFISLDDMLLPHAISEKIAIMSNNPNCMFVANSKILKLEEGKIKKHYPELLINSIKNITIDNLIELEYSNLGSFYIQTAIFRKFIVDCVSGFEDDMIGDDIVLRTKIFLYMKKKNYSFHIKYTPSAIYRIHDTNIHKNTKRQLKAVIQYYDRYWIDRAYPELLKKWLINAIHNNSFFDILEVFTISHRSSLLLLDKNIQIYLYISAIKKFINDNRA